MNNIFARLSGLFRRPEPTVADAARIMAQRAEERRRAKRAAYVAAHIKAMRESMK